jgi:hypothetical protein
MQEVRQLKTATKVILGLTTITAIAGLATVLCTDIVDIPVGRHHHLEDDEDDSFFEDIE